MDVWVGPLEISGKAIQRDGGLMMSDAAGATKMLGRLSRSAS